MTKVQRQKVRHGKWRLDGSAFDKETATGQNKYAQYSGSHRQKIDRKRLTKWL